MLRGDWLSFLDARLDIPEVDLRSSGRHQELAARIEPDASHRFFVNQRFPYELPGHGAPDPDSLI